jgi:hypothetical protein
MTLMTGDDVERRAEGSTLAGEVIEGVESLIGDVGGVEVLIGEVAARVRRPEASISRTEVGGGNQSTFSTALSMAFSYS